MQARFLHIYAVFMLILCIHYDSKLRIPRLQISKKLALNKINKKRQAPSCFFCLPRFPNQKNNAEPDGSAYLIGMVSQDTTHSDCRL